MKVTIEVTPDLLRQILIYEMARETEGNTLPESMTVSEMQDKVRQHIVWTSESCRSRFATPFTRDEESKVEEWAVKVTKRVK